MGRNYLWFRHGDANNAILAAVGYHFRRLIRWLRFLLHQILAALCPDLRSVQPEITALHGRQNIKTRSGHSRLGPVSEGEPAIRLAVASKAASIFSLTISSASRSALLSPGHQLHRPQRDYAVGIDRQHHQRNEHPPPSP
jgi:hypothetical protein